jgi:hypothetical protein
VAVFTKYDVFVESLVLKIDDYLCGGDIDEEIENLDNDPGMGLSAGTSAPQIDQEVLSRAEKQLGEMIKPFEEKLGVPWVKVSGLDICLSFWLVCARSN